MVQAARVPTGIKGFDEMLGGGFPKNHHILVAGGPGTGKTSFCMEYLYRGAMKGENGAFLTLEEPPEKIIGDTAASFEWPEFQKFLRDGTLSVTSCEVYNFQNLMDLLQSKVTQHSVKRVAIDSLTMLSVFFTEEHILRRNFAEMLKFLGSMDCTAVLTVERPFMDRDRMVFSFEEFVTDSVVVLYNLPRRNERVRALEGLKIRGSPHSKNIYPFEITRDGLIVYPQEIL
jgi:circadian clock protein KaiC